MCLILNVISVNTWHNNRMHDLHFLFINPKGPLELTSFRGWAFKAPPYKNPFRGPFGPVFSHNCDWGTKIT